MRKSLLLILFLLINQLSIAQSMEGSYRRAKRDANTREQMRNDPEFGGLVVIGLSIFIGLFVLNTISKSRKKNRLEKERKLHIKNRLALIDSLVASNQIDQKSADELIEYLNGRIFSEWAFDKKLDEAKSYYKLKQFIFNKYGTEIGGKLLGQEYWIGMTKEQLIDAKGEPTKIETESLKTKTKEILIYGNKSSGDYFVFENGLATKIVDR